MARLPESDPMDPTLHRKFPDADVVRPRLTSLGLGLTPGREDHPGEASATDRQNRAVGLGQTFRKERGSGTGDIAVRAEREEQARFFNRPDANADFEHWSKAAHWTLDEAIALSFGKAPECVTWDMVKHHVGVSAFAFQYQRRRNLALRATARKQLSDPVLPGFFLAWARRTDIPVPADLENAVTARGVQVADWKSMYDALVPAYEKLTKTLDEYTQQFAELAEAKDREIERLRKENEDLGDQVAAATIPAPPAVPEKSLGVRERESLLKLVIGMAVGGYSHDPKGSRSQQTAAIASDLATCGVALDVDTVRKWLREAADLLPPQTERD